MEKTGSTVKLWNKDFILIVIINLLIFMNHIMLLTTFPLFLKSVLGIDEGIAGLAALGFSLVAIIVRPFVGWLLNNGMRKAILIPGLLGAALMPAGYILSDVLATAGYALTSIIVFAVICRMLQGLALSMENTAAATVASDALPVSRFAEGMGYYGMSTAIATAAAPALGMALKNVSFILMFAVAIAFNVIAALLALTLKTHGPAVVEKQPLKLKGLFDKDALPASVVCVVFLLTYGALENFIATFAEANNMPSSGVFFLVLALFTVAARFLLGKKADEKGEAIFVYSCNASMFLAYVLLSFIPNNITFFVSAALAGYAFGGMEPALQAMAIHIAPPERRGSANSTFLCAYDIGMGCGAGLAGFLISSFDYKTMFMVISVSTIISTLIYVLWGRKHPSSLRFKQQEN